MKSANVEIWSTDGLKEKSPDHRGRIHRETSSFHLQNSGSTPVYDVDGLEVTDSDQRPRRQGRKIRQFKQERPLQLNAETLSVGGNFIVNQQW